MRHFVSTTMVIGRRRRITPTASTTQSIVLQLLFLLFLLGTKLPMLIDAAQISNYDDVGRCGLPGTPFDGSTNPVKSDYYTRDAVTFTCRAGYILVGPHQITCRKDSTWSGDPPQCMKEAAEIERSIISDDNVNTCTDLTNRQPLKLRTSPFSQHSIKAIVISLSKVTGSPNVDVTISNDGANPQSCTTIQNVMLQDSNVYHKFDCGRTVIGSTLQISVKSTQVFSPMASVTLCEIGVLDAFVGTRKCGLPQIPANSIIKNQTEDRIIYRCFPGLYVRGSATSYCEDGVWKNQVQCTSITLQCGFPGSPKNGFHEYADEVTRTVRYACFPGYILVGPNTRSCLQNGTWSPQTIPKCLTNVAYGKYVSHSDMSRGDNKPSVDENPETCDVIGYNRVDVAKQRWWKLDFGNLRPISNVRVVQPKGQQKRLKVAYFTSDRSPMVNIPCVANFDLGILVCDMRTPTNAAGIYIQPDERQDNITLCEVQVTYQQEQVSCDTIDEQLNGKVTYEQNNALMSCDVDYSLSGPSVITCEDGSWKPPYPTCTVAAARSPTVPPNRQPTARPTSSIRPTSGKDHEVEKDNFIVGIIGIAIGVTAASLSIIIAIVVIVCVMKRHYKKKHSCNHDCSPDCSRQNTSSTTYNRSGGGGSAGGQRDWDEISIHLYETVKPEYDTLDPCVQSLVVNESYVLASPKNSLNRNPLRPRLAPPRSNHIYDVPAEETLLDRNGRPRENGGLTNGHGGPVPMMMTTVVPTPRRNVILGPNLPRTDL